jgi:Rrf2 family protein
MTLTRAGEYAIRCVLYLSTQAQGEVIGRRAIALAMDIPNQFLGKIAQRLARAGILEITQGAKGGYQLTKPPAAITLLDVVEAVEGPISLNHCVIQPGSCPRSPQCAVHRVWEEALSQMKTVLGGADFAELARQEMETGVSIYTPVIIK